MRVQGVKPWVLWLVGKLGAVWPQSSGPILDLSQSWGSGEFSREWEGGKGVEDGQTGVIGGFPCAWNPLPQTGTRLAPHFLQISAQKSPTQEVFPDCR